mmetsp:Transcript_22714/g.38056  ORF Transcript_22714/g.38056 Transcript_22714/m.38056 type:complete len:500 (-) Transcript_22714:74-1573(-)
MQLLLLLLFALLVLTIDGFRNMRYGASLTRRAFNNFVLSVKSPEEDMNLAISVEAYGFLNNIKQYGDNRMARRAVGILQKMPAYNVMPTEIHYTETLWACEKSDQYKLAYSVYQEMQAKNIQLTSSSYEALISVAEKTGHFEETVAFFQEMMDAGFSGTSEAYNFCLMALEQDGKYDAAIDLLDKMKAEGIPRDMTTYTACTRACENAGEGPTAIRLLEMMRAEGIAASADPYNGALWACVKGGYTREALMLFEQMKDLNVRYDATSYNAAIWAAEQLGDEEKSVMYLRYMKLDKIDRQTMSFDGALSALNRADKWQQIIEILSWMNLDGVAKSPVTYKIAIDALDRHKENQLVGETYIEALRDGYFSPWVEKSRLMDLRGFSLAMAKIALKSVLLSMVDGKMAVFALRMIVGDVAVGPDGCIADDPEVSTTFDVTEFELYLRNLSLKEEFAGASHGVEISRVNDNADHRLVLDKSIEETTEVVSICRDSLIAWIGDIE